MSCWLVVKISLVALALLTGCSHPTEAATQPTPSVISLKENLPALQAVARQWRADAYFVDADIPVEPKLETGNWLISAGFESMSSSREVLLVNLGLDGTISQTQIPSSAQPSKPILDEGWPLDSQEALDRLLEHERQVSSVTTLPDCSSLDLDRYRAAEPVVWVLTLTTCALSHDAKYIWTDAVTGDFLEQP